MKQSFSNLNLKLEHSAEVHLPANPKKVYLLLHGYMLDGKYIYDKFKDTLPNDCAIIAPNGPFTVPYKNKKGYHQRYAWYFFDPDKKIYYIDFVPAANYLKSLLIELNLVKKPITVIGYSQGGYLAPKLAEIIPSVDTVIGVACCFRNERFEFKNNSLIHQINSIDDLVVDYKSAKVEFNKLREKGNLGRFVSLENIGHKLDREFLDEVQKII